MKVLGMTDALTSPILSPPLRPCFSFPRSASCISKGQPLFELVDHDSFTGRQIPKDKFFASRERAGI